MMEFLSSWQTNKQGKNKPQNSGIFVFCVLCCCVLIICLCKLVGDGRDADRRVFLADKTSNKQQQKLIETLSRI